MSQYNPDIPIHVFVATPLGLAQVQADYRTQALSAACAADALADLIEAELANTPQPSEALRAQAALTIAEERAAAAALRAQWADAPQGVAP